MNLFHNISAGLKHGIKFRSIALYILLIQLALSLLIGVLTFNYIQSSIGDSTNLFKIIGGYDHDVFQDLLRFESTGWSMIKTLTMVVVVIYILLGPMIMGGILNAFRKSKDNWLTFWMGGSRYYLPFLKINIIITLIAIIFLSVFLAISMFVMNYGLNNFKSEIPMVSIWGILLLVYICIIILLVNTSTIAKWIIMNEKRKVWKAFSLSFKMVIKKWFYFLVLGFVFMALSIILALVLNYFINCVPESGFALIILAMLLQIASLYLRIVLRNSYYASILKSIKS